MLHHWRWLCALVLLSPAMAQEPAIDRPAASRRLVRLFDFEQREKYAVPQYWDMAQDGQAGARPGFPAYNKAEHDTGVAANGSGSVRLSTRGGSVCLRLQPGVVPVFPETDYLVSARMKTRGLTHARGALVARFLDRANAPIAGSEARSVLAASEEWRSLSCTLPGRRADAAYLQIDLTLLQEDQFAAGVLGEHQVWANDFPGDAWFDDVEVVQLPRVLMATNDATNFIQHPKRPAIVLSLRDLTGEALSGKLELRDAAGTVVDRSNFELGAGGAGREERTWEPAVSALGWYRATLELSAKSGRVGGTHVDFVWLAAEERVRAPSADRTRFGVLLDSLPVWCREMLPEIVARLGTGTVGVPVWERGQQAESVEALSRDLLPLVTALQGKWQRVSFILPRVPEELGAAAHVEPDQALALLGMDPKVWSPHLLPLLDRYGQMVQRWQIGRAGDPPPRTTDAAGAMSRFESALSKLVPGPVVALPWPSELSPAGARAGELLAHVPYASAPAAIGELGAVWGPVLAPSRTALSLELEPLPEDQYSRRDSASRLVKQGVEFWNAFMPTQGGVIQGNLALVQPWSWPASTRGQPMPTAEAAALANVARKLSDRRVAGRLPVGPGVVCFILAPAAGAPGRTGALAAWTEGGPGAELEAFLGDGAVTVSDLWGNARPVKAERGSEGSGPPSHRIRLSDEPVFIENVDVGLARFIAGFKVDPEFVPCTGAEHDVAVVLSNPFATRADGRLSILEPGGLSRGERDRSWRVTPRTMPFSIEPGQTVRLPVSVSFSPVEEAGPKPFIVEVELVADRDYGALRMRTNFEIRLEELQMDLAYRLIPGTQDLVVETHITNKGAAAATIELSAFAPDLPRARASIAELPPGQTAMRRFAFPGGAATLRGKRIVVGAQDAETRARVNRSIQIE